MRQVSELVHEAFETVGTGLETLPALGFELIGARAWLPAHR